MTITKGKALITGASSGIGAVYADRLARRGYDLILVARNGQRLDALARRLHAETGCGIEAIAADLNRKADIVRIEGMLRGDEGISLLVNNAGSGAPTPLLETPIDRLEEMLALNVGALTRLSYAAVQGFITRGGGTLVNIASVLALAPELFNGVYGGSKAYVLAFSRALRKEFAEANIRVQAVLPGATATEFWEQTGTPLNALPSGMVMSVDDMVDAALAGLDQGEFITIPSLPDYGDLLAYEHARDSLLPNLSRDRPASRYLRAQSA